MDCVFCAIVQKKIPAEIVFEDADTLSFLTITPVHGGHTLVIPKQHYEDLFELPENLLAKLFVVGKRVAKAVMNSTKAEGINLEMNNKLAAGQMIFHAHLHIIPRFSNDGLRHWAHKEMSQQELTQMREKIAREFQQ
ncbi:MAG: HIT family protein [Candidatus Woesearchaeota archaeon]|nr:HIT family protein [Candidatus Woesearchaeota archaeon]